MKKVFVLIVITVLFISCGSYKSLNLDKLTTGMTKEEVIYRVGEPRRVLAVNNTSDGYQEVLEYRTSRNEVYALEFWNDYLTGYEFLYDDVEYIAPAPPAMLPDYGRPIIVGRPSRPSRPTTPSRTNRPTEPSRSTTPSRTNDSNRTNESGRPATNTTTARPTGDGRTSTRSTTTTTETEKEKESTTTPERRQR
ncbi:MAG: hypothetical protein LBN74_01000 [Prevotella sp.]|jgi:hypothetical protein|nr:hypothetical protein [Prevotella sp.]